MTNRPLKTWLKLAIELVNYQNTSIAAKIKLKIKSERTCLSHFFMFKFSNLAEKEGQKQH
jgi:hypothetical protein